MSVADEILRIQQAKSDLATSIENKGVTVPAATTIDGYAALVDQIQQGGTPVLPYDSKIAYLESTGTQWIDTGILYQVGMTILMSAMCTGNYSSVQVFAAPSAEGGCWFGNGNNGVLRCSAGNIGSSKVRTTVIYSYGNAKAFMFGNETVLQPSKSTNPTTSPIHIFGVNGNYLSSARIYSCQIHDANNNVLADFIPVRKGTVGYLYDRVSNTLFGNDGTGSFTLGPDVT